MYGVVGHVKEERPVLVPSDEADRLVGFAVGKIFTLLSGFEGWDCGLSFP